LGGKDAGNYDNTFQWVVFLLGGPMSFRILLAFPLVGAAVLLVFFLAGINLIGDLEVLVVKLLGFVGVFWALLTFKRGEYLCWAFLSLTVCYFCLLFFAVLSLLPVSWSENEIADGLRVVFILGANAFQVIGVLVLARAWNVAGMDFPVAPWKKNLLMVVVVGLSFAVAGPPLVDGVRDMIQGNMGAFEVFSVMVSGLGDTISLCLIAPLLLTAWALRGGMLSWTWAFIAASMMAWLCLDAVDVWGPAWGLSAEELNVSRDIFRAMACLFGFSTGLSQVMIRRRFRARS
jgi:hypothetical protein